MPLLNLLESARRTAARSVNALLTASYWEIGRHVVEFEQAGQDRPEYGSRLLERLSADLTSRFGRGFSVINLRQMRRFYLLWPSGPIRQTLSVEFTEAGPRLQDDEKGQTASVVFPIVQTTSEASRKMGHSH